MKLEVLKDAIGLYINHAIGSNEVVDELHQASDEDKDEIIFFLAEFVISKEAEVLEAKLDAQRISRRGRSRYRE